jgi:tRNA pseudouridine38-40 synthase
VNPELIRYKLLIEYIGTGLVGWQRQANGISVQQVLEEAIEVFTGFKTVVFAAGRTDAGVHAIGQVVHFDLPQLHDPIKFNRSLNHFLRLYPIGSISCELVSPSFHARFSAQARHYLYKIVNRTGRVAVEYGRSWHVRHKLDLSVMQTAAAYLIGTHDFTSYRAKNCQSKSPVKTLSKLDIEKTEPDFILFHFSAPSFLHHMVRNIVGSLVLVGCGFKSPDYIKEALLAKAREAAGPTAPPDGLYFTKVDY